MIDSRVSRGARVNVRARAKSLSALTHEESLKNARSKRLAVYRFDTVAPECHYAMRAALSRCHSLRRQQAPRMRGCIREGKRGKESSPLDINNALVDVDTKTIDRDPVGF